MANAPHNSKRPALKSVSEAVAKGDISAVLQKLTLRQRRFCEEYCIDYNGKAAAIRAGYATKWADRQAENLLKNIGVRAYVDDLTTSKTAKIVSVDPDYVIGEIIAALNVAKDKTNLTAWLRATELLARHLGMLTDKQEITGKDGGPLSIEQQKIEEDAKTFTNLLKQLNERAQREKNSESEGVRD